MDYNHKKLVRRFGDDCFQFASHGCYGSFEPDKIPLKLEMTHVPSGNSVFVKGYYTGDYEKAKSKCYSLMWDRIKRYPTKTHIKKLNRYRKKNKMVNKIRKAKKLIQMAVCALLD